MDGVRDPEELEAAGAPASAQIAAATVLGPVRLVVSDLQRSLDYYRSAVGLRLLAGEGTQARLGVGGHELLILDEQPGARSSAGYTGLYHFALLLSERAQLARWLAHAARERVALVGMSDHFVSEAIYLSDPDGHGIEIYWDRPRAIWEGQVASRMTTMALDVDGLLGELDARRAEPFDGLPADTAMGHVHLKVASIGETVAFYRDALGLGLMAALGSSAAFLSAGGYHHHVGANTWESAGAGRAAARQRGARSRDDRAARRARARAGAGAPGRARAAPRKSSRRPDRARPVGERAPVDGRRGEVISVFSSSDGLGFRAVGVYR